MTQLILILGKYLFPINDLSKKKHVTCRGIRNTQALKVSYFAVCMVELNEYLAEYTGSDVGNKVFEGGLNEILLHSMPDR